MSLFESNESTAEISLAKLFGGVGEVSGFSKVSLEDIAHLLTRGGWPVAVLETNEKAARRAVYSYVEVVINEDMSEVDGITKSPARVRNLMRSLARNVATAASVNTIRQDIIADDEELSPNTISQYINALRQLFVVEDMAAWTPRLLSKAAVRTSPTRHFVDPSIAAAVLRAGPDHLLHDFSTFGILFESLCIRDLRIYAEGNDGESFHYRDNSGLEADCIVQLKDGRWGAVEVKMGSGKFDEAARNLILLKDRINTDRMPPPSFLMILSASDIAYRRSDGVLVVPLGCLGP
jgi:predicted AAA+ superfamily ATPase